MTKRISEELIIGNALISTNKKSLTIQQFYQYCNIVEELLPEEYYFNNTKDFFVNFCEEYSFLVKRVEDTMIVNCDNRRLERYFRMGAPSEIIKIFDIAGDKLNQIEAKESINCNGKSFECNNKIVKESGKIFAKTKSLLK